MKVKMDVLKSPKNLDRILEYLLQPVHAVIQFPPAVQSQQPHVLPLGHQEVNLGILGFNGSLGC